MPDSTRRPTRRSAAILLLAGAFAAPIPAWPQGAKQSAITGADVAALKPGQFIWAPQLAPKGPMVMIVSLTAQRAFVYRNGLRIGASTVSTGKKGKETPTGVFTILQKNEKHRSNLYNNAPMPYMQRLTWDGIALHAGNLPGYPASHGCVRLPMAFASALFAETSMGMTVVVTRGAPNPARLDDGDLLAPVTAEGGSAAGLAAQRLAAHEPYRWQPELAPAGPVTILVSSHDQRLMVMRNGKLIGRGRIQIPPGRVSGDHALQFTGFDAQQRTHWTYVSVPGQEQLKGRALDFSGARDLKISPEYLKRVRSVLTPGATMLITDAAILGGGAGKPMTVIDSNGA
jgi:hypothetical protein